MNAQYPLGIAVGPCALGVRIGELTSFGVSVGWKGQSKGAVEWSPSALWLNNLLIRYRINYCLYLHVHTFKIAIHC